MRGRIELGVGVRATVGVAFTGVGVRVWDTVRATTECGGALVVRGRAVGGGFVPATERGARAGSGWRMPAAGLASFGAFAVPVLFNADAM